METPGWNLPEHHEEEQYFFDDAVAYDLARVLAQFERPCCLCAPTVGIMLVHLKKTPIILDIDERFSGVPGFRKFDMNNPEWSALAEIYPTFETWPDVVLCDPPFFKVTFSRLYRIIQNVVHWQYKTPILVTCLARRAKAFLPVFNKFTLAQADYGIRYKTVAPTLKNLVSLYTNVDAERLKPLTEGT